MLMELDILTNGKEYISASRASEKTGYASDYIGQLARAGKIAGKLIGRTWYVDLDALLEHKRTRQLGRGRKSRPTHSGESFVQNKGLVAQVVKEAREDSVVIKNPVLSKAFFKETLFTYENDLRSHLPTLSKAGRYVEPVWNTTLAREAVAIALALIMIVSSAVSTLESVNPKFAKSLQNFSQTLTPNFDTHQLASIGAVSDVLDFFVNGFQNLKQFALGSSVGKPQGPIIKSPKTTPTQETPAVAEVPAQNAVAVTQTTAPLSLESLRNDLRNELESYVRAQLSSADSPVVIYQSGPTYNTTILRDEILLADTRPTVTRQSSSDVENNSSAITRLINEGVFYNSVLSNASVSGPNGGFTAFTFGEATGTSATTTNLYSTNAVFGNISGVSLDLTSLVFGNATGTNATTTTLAILGDGAGLTFYGTGNHDISAQSGTLRIGGNTIIGNIEALNSTIDIGTPMVRFDKIYADEVNASTIVGTLTGGNLTAETMSINSDNATADTEDSFLAFERGTVTPNALLRWNSTSDNFEFNFPLMVLGSTTLQNLTFQNATGTNATTTNLFVSNLASTTDLRVANTALFGGNVGIGTNAPTSLLHVNGTLRVHSPTTLGQFFITYPSGSPNLRIQDTNGTETVNIASGGDSYFNGNNLGVGTTTPSYKLAVSGSGFFDGGTIYASTIVATSSLIAQNSTTTNATTTNLFVSGLASTTALRANTAIFGGNVGIGTTTPDQKLVVDSNTDTFLKVNSTSASGDARIQFTNTADANNMYQIGRDDDGVFRLFRDVTTKFSLDASDNFFFNGNVGIGTTTPQAVLHTVGQIRSSVADDTTAFRITDATNNDAISLYRDTNKSFTIDVGSATRAFTIKNTGNVGIGTSNPSNPLHVVGAARVTTYLGVGGAPVTGDTLATYNTTGATQLRMTNTSVSTNWQWYLNTSSSESDLRLFEGGSGTSGDRITFKTGGNVGIGTTNPSTKLEVNGGLLVTGSSTIQSFTASNSTSTNATTTNLFVSGLASTTSLRANTAFFGGNVDIGTTTASRILTIQSSIDADRVRIINTNSSGATANLTLEQTSANTKNWLLTTNFTAVGDFELRQSNSSGGDPYQAGTTRFIIKNAGNVGIGTTNPTAFHTKNLELYGGSGGSAGIRLTNDGTGMGAGNSMGSLDFASGSTRKASVYATYDTDATDARLGLFTTASGGSITERMRITGAGLVGIGSTTPYALLGVENVGSGLSFAVNDVANDSRPFVIDASGSVGIGTTAPLSRLHLIQEGSGGGGGPGNGTTPTAGFVIGDYGTGGALNMGIDATGSFYSWIQSRDKASAAYYNLALNPYGGNVGIGTTNPGAPLQVNLASDGLVAILGSGGATNPQFRLSGGQNFDIVNVGTTRVGFEIGDSEKLSILAGGNIGIGTTTPAHMLTIASSTGPQLTLTDGVAGSNPFSFRQIGSMLYIATSSQTSFATSTSPLFMINGWSGNIGIGTTNPTATLQLGSNTLASFNNFEVRNFGSVLDDVGMRFGTDGDYAIGYANSTDTLNIVDGTGLTSNVRLTLNSSGNIGLGTTNPATAKLDIRSAASANDYIGLIVNQSDADNYAVDITAAAYGMILRGSSGAQAILQTTGTDKVLFGGNVGIGTTSPWVTLAVAGRVALPNLVNNATGYYACVNTAGGGAELATSTTACGASSIKYKEHVENLNYDLEDLMRLRPVSFDWKHDFMPDGTHQIGFIAEEVEGVVPEIIGYDSHGEVMNMDYAKLTSLIVKAVQEIANITGMFKENLIAWLGDMSNGIEKLFAKEVHSEKLCLKKSDGTEICVTGDELSAAIAGSSNNTNFGPVIIDNGGGGSGGEDLNNGTSTDETALDSGNDSSSVEEENNANNGGEVAPDDGSGSSEEAPSGGESGSGGEEISQN